MKRTSLLALFLACAELLPAAGSMIPLATGNTWTYRDQASGETFTMRVGPPVYSWTTGQQYFSLRGYAGSAPSSANQLVRLDEAGNLVLWDEETGEEKLAAGFGVAGGRPWQSHGHSCAAEGRTQAPRVAYSGSAGRFEQVLEVRYRTFACTTAPVEAELFAENVGMLRRVVQGSGGPRTFDLVYARVGNMVLEPMERGRFSVALEQVTGKRALRATLRLDLGTLPLKTRFGSSQEFDLTLLDPAGNAVWTWSEGQFFAGVIQEKNLTSGWSATVEVPLPAGSLEGYAVQGWLATAPGEARFAAVAPVPAALVTQ